MGGVMIFAVSSDQKLIQVIADLLVEGFRPTDGEPSRRFEHVVIVRNPPASQEAEIVRRVLDIDPRAVRIPTPPLS